MSCENILMDSVTTNRSMHSLLLLSMRSVLRESWMRMCAIRFYTLLVNVL